MIEFTESLRYVFDDIGRDSTILNIGGHTGNFAKLMCERYDCHALVFEPMKFYYKQAVATLAPFPKARVFQMAIGGSNRSDTFGLHGDMSGKFSDGPPETVVVRDIAEVFGEFGVDEFILGELNCEGSEFEIMERILEAGLATRFRHLQVQFHTVAPNYLFRLAAIHAKLALTHDLTFDEPFCWTGWSRKT